jgi:hypothetical protein
MDVTVDVYLTSRKDSLQDLRKFTNELSFSKWKSEVKNIAFYTESYKELSDKLLTEAEKYPILDAFAVIEYPQGEAFTADDEVCEKIRDVFRKKMVSFQWNLTRDEEAAPGSFKVSLEIVCDKDE